MDAGETQLFESAGNPGPNGARENDGGVNRGAAKQKLIYGRSSGASRGRRRNSHRLVSEQPDFASVFALVRGNGVGS